MGEGKAEGSGLSAEEQLQQAVEEIAQMHQNQEQLERELDEALQGKGKDAEQGR